MEVNGYSNLEQIRLYQGADKCREAFSQLFYREPWRAIGLLNDSAFTFPCLYILLGQIEELHIKRHLNQRNAIAVEIINQIRLPGSAEVNYLASKQGQAQPILKWILETGAVEEIPEDEFEEIMEVAVSVLINTYGDREILPLVAELIFKRNRKGRYIHDLVFALFRVRDPQVLKLIVEHIRSSDAKDAKLAAELLNIDEPGGGEEQCAKYLSWLNENEPYLYFTGECFQYASRPTFAAVDVERKGRKEGKI